jgi:hypothetical protein
MTAAPGPDALIRYADLRLLAAWIAVAAACLALARWAGAAPAAALAAGLLLGTNVTTAAYHATAPWSTTYFYGTGGQAQAGAWVRAQLADLSDPAGLVVADREVAYYARPVHFLDSERFIELASAPAGLGKPAVASAPGWPIRLIVSRHGRVAELLPAGARAAGSFGAYRAWIVEPAASSG